MSEGLQPAELGWGTHEKELPPEGRHHEFGPRLRHLSAAPRRRHAGPLLDADAGPQHGFLVTHNKSISIADYLTVREGDKVVYRPTCHYAYRPGR